MNIVDGDILDDEHGGKGVICHQVNCMGVMGAGIAAQIRKKWPAVYKEYSDLCAMHPDDSHMLLGQIQIVPVDEGRWVANLFSQHGTGGERATEYSAFIQCCEKLRDWAYKTGNTLWDSIGGFDKKMPICFPYGIGCGLGGGDWNIIKDIIRRKLPDAYVFKLKKS